ncbi:MAG: type I 3-dehydroquinate dehydratase [Desulfobacteraceae bacterium]|nr:type I 3-dehydroquinate dehydratase [Desulfobacteraceae bacterium]
MTKPKPALCGCLLDVSQERLAACLNHPSVEWIEWRLDHTIRSHSLEKTLELLGALHSPERRPVIATNRAQREGGVFNGDEATRFAVLQKASRDGAEWVDLEADVPAGVLEEFKSGNSAVLLSRHDFDATPDAAALRRTVERMAARRPHALKIVTYARSPEDNLRTLELIPFARREFGIETIAFCMGPLGLWSRFGCLLLGSPWTYVQLPGQEASAPGQVDAERMRALLDAGAWMFNVGPS